MNEIKRDRSFIDLLQTPCSCFVTLESEEATGRAGQYDELVAGEGDCLDYVHYDRFLDSKISLQEASEPTDIIWENRQVTETTRAKRRCVTNLVILVMLLLSGSVIYFSTVFANKKKFKYPKVDCFNVLKRYGGEEGYRPLLEDWIKDSANSVATNKAREAEGEKTLYDGTMECLCNYYAKSGSRKAGVTKLEFTND